MYITKNVLADILPMCVDGVNGTFSLIPIPQMGTLVVAGVHHGLQIDIAGALEVADAEGVLAQQLTPGRVLSTCRSLKQGLAFSMAITWAGMSSSLRQGLGLEPEQPFEAGTQLVLVEDILDGRAGHGDAAQLELGADPDAAAGGILAGHGEDLVDHLRWGGGQMAVVDGRQVLEAGQAVDLEAARVLVEGGAVHLRLAGGGGDVAQGRGQLEDAEPVAGQFGRGIVHGSFLGIAFGRGGTSVRYAHSASTPTGCHRTSGEMLNCTSAENGFLPVTLASHSITTTGGFQRCPAISGDSMRYFEDT